MVYDVQQVSMPSTKLTDSVVLYLKDYYLTPYSNIKFYTPSFTSGASAREVQIAIESLANVDSLDVPKQTSSSGGVDFFMTFLSNLDEVPLLVSNNTAASVSSVSIGVGEVPTITVACDNEFVREEQLFDYSTTFQLQFSYMGAATPVTLTQCAVHCGIHLSRQAAIIELFYYGQNSTPLQVEVTLSAVTQFHQCGLHNYVYY